MSEGSTHRRSESSPFPSEDDDDKSHSSHSSKEPSAIGQTMEDEELAIAKEEDLAVFKIRLAVAVSLFFCTVSVGCIVYINTRNQEQTLFQSDFEDFSMKVLGTFGNTLHQSIAALDIYAVECTSYAKSMNMTWPFVFLPNSATRFSKVLRLAKASLVSVIPVVAHSEREEWDVFSMKRGPEWVENNLRVQTGDPGFTGTKLEEYSISPLWGLGGPLQNQSRYFPVWQQYPTASSIALLITLTFRLRRPFRSKKLRRVWFKSQMYSTTLYLIPKPTFSFVTSLEVIWMSLNHSVIATTLYSKMPPIQFPCRIEWKTALNQIWLPFSPSLSIGGTNS